MNKVDKALHEMCQLDKEASAEGFLNKLNTGIKLIVTIFYLVCVMWVDSGNLPLLILFIVYPVMIFILSDISFMSCLRRMKYLFGFVMIMALANLFFADTLILGVILMMGLLIKGALSITSVYILIATTKIESICETLRRIHIPEIIVTTILLIYRYINVLLKEFKKMSEGYSMMTVGEKGIRISYAGAFLGNLILRSIDRAKLVYDSMNLRGYEWNIGKRK